MNKISTLIKSFALVILVAVFLPACRNSKVVCPGAGQSSASDMALFNEDGEPISKKKKKKASKKNDYGLINKKQPTNMKRRVKRSIDDRPNKVR